MRSKSPKLVFTFDTTASVMALEKACAGEPSLGRIIPVPQQISAGCGLAWCAPPEARETILALLRREEIPLSGMTVVELY